MKTQSNTGRGPRLVTSAPAVDDKLAHLIAEGMLKFQTLQDQFDAEAFSETPDMELIEELLLGMGTLRERLAAHGVKV